MTSTKKTVLEKCPYCAKEVVYKTILTNGNCPCPFFKKLFTLIENQGDTHWQVQIQKLENELSHYKQHNRNLQSEVALEKIKNKLEAQENSSEKIHNEQLLTQIKKLKDEKQKYDKNLLERNEEISLLKDQNQKLEQANQDLKKKLLEKDEEICRLKNQGENLITYIKKLKGEKKSQQETSKKLASKE